MKAATKKASDKGWPAWKVERRSLKKLRPYAQNARLHDDAQVDQIAASMKEFGWTIPVLCDEKGDIIAGHGRVLAGLRLKYSDAPVIVARGWSVAQKRAYRLLDNRLAENSKWDREKLKSEVASLDGLFDLNLLGWSDADVKDMLGVESFEPPEIDDEAEGSVETEIECPKCGHTWGGKSGPSK